MRLIIHAPNIHSGGGRALLLSLLQSIEKRHACHIIVDERLVMDEQRFAGVVAKRVAPNIRGRLSAENWLRQFALSDDVVLCFGNLPPLFSLAASVSVFLQNRLLVDDFPTKEFSFRTQLRIFAERCWLRAKSKSVRHFLVQTPTMKRMVLNQLGLDAIVAPFLIGNGKVARANLQALDGARKSPCLFDFLYVASGEPHKNHIRLIEAWVLLAVDNVRPVLCLTLPLETNQRLCELIDDAKSKYNLNIINMGALPFERIQLLYKETKALIFPSMLESLGLPLIEARNAGLPIIASELDYVRDLLDPEESFDPHSPLSIARSIKRFLGVEEKHFQFLEPATFINSLFEKC